MTKISAEEVRENVKQQMRYVIEQVKMASAVLEERGFIVTGEEIIEYFENIEKNI